MVGECDFKPANLPSTYGPVWAYGYLYNWSGTGPGLNKHDGNPSANYGTFRSEHTGGASFLMAGGSVHFFRESMSPQTFTALGTRAGGETASVD